MFSIQKAMGILLELWELAGNTESNPFLPDRKAKRKLLVGFFTLT